MWIGSNISIVNPAHFTIKDCAVRPPVTLPIAEGSVSLGDSFGGKTHVMLLIENGSLGGGDNEDERQVGENGSP